MLFVTNFVLNLKYIKRLLISIIRRIISNYYVSFNVFFNNNHHNGRIKVGYILQLPEVFDKAKPVLDLIEHDNRFDLYILVVPIFNDLSRIYEYKYDYSIVTNKFKNIVFLLKDNNNIDIRSYNFNYVFYQRPYDSYLPNKYRSSELVKFTKCCYISYAFYVFKGLFSGYNYEFFDNMYLSFMESNEAIDNILKNFKAKRLYFEGYPVLSEIKYEYNLNNNILWTPRWTHTNNESHFFNYKDSLFRLTNKYKKKLIIRPHPLAFQNYIKQGLITKIELEEWKNNILKYNACIDQNENIFDTFDSTSILITDISSIIIEYLLTGRPIIYCNGDTDFNEYLVDIKDLLYVANSYEDIENIFKDLINGYDPLLEKRRLFIETFNNKNKNAAERIRNYLLK